LAPISLNNALPRLSSNARSAILSISTQRTRSILSSIGIAVGTIAIVLLISIARGVQTDISSQVRDFGVNLLIVLPGRVDPDSMMNASIMGISHLRESHADSLRELNGVQRAVPLTFVGGGVQYGEQSSPSSLVIATGPDWFRMRNMNLAEGELFDESQLNEPIMVLGGVAKRNLFGDEPALGKIVTLNQEEYRVVAVTQDQQQEQSLLSMGSFENVIYIPFDYVKEQLGGNLPIDRIMVQTVPELEPKEVIASVSQELSNALDENQFSVLTQEDLLGLIYRVLGILTWLLTGLTSIALFVGGVGIMTIMLMSVSERSKEIGIRKTVGANRRDIFSQFLVEAIILAVIGCTAGVIISWGVCLALITFTPVKPDLGLDIVGVSFAVAIGIGGIFGLLPAIRAATFDPVVALRNEN
jgi:putative ABC transport system permease protein